MRISSKPTVKLDAIHDRSGSGTDEKMAEALAAKAQRMALLATDANRDLADVWPDQ